jgi:uncharacterized glyoxalase superfamily protein PhnB
VQLASFYPVICAEDVPLTANFYRQHFGFAPTFESEWYVSPRHLGANHYELAILDPNHPTMPASFRAQAKGLLLNFEVADVDAEYKRLVIGAGLPEVLPIRDESFRQRHFIVADPNGVPIDVISVIPPSAEFAASYRE